MPMELLDTQYRMHPLIAEFPSDTFYNGRLKSGVTAEERPLPKVCLPSRIRTLSYYVTQWGVTAEEQPLQKIRPIA